MTVSTVADNTVVSIHYTLKDSDGEVLDSSAGEKPLTYLHGASNIVPGLERELVGKAVGDKLDVVVQPADAYGVRQGPEPQKVPLSSFPEGAQLAEGMQIVAKGPNEEMFPLWVVGVGDDHVLLDHNHPLSDMTLHFQVEITEIRSATEEEIAHGHPHGPGGHHHH